VHEFGLCEAIMEAVERRASGRRVSRVTVRIGTMHRVVEPAFDQAFSLVSAGTVAEDAALDLVVLPVRTRCRTCGADATSEDPLALCPRCESSDVTVEGGDELVLESIEIHA
jgi:hydrogenase nickel incorporation protein HypA/HybF